MNTFRRYIICIGEKILHWISSDRDTESAIGDIEEIYSEIVSSKGRILGTLWCGFQIIKSILNQIYVSIYWSLIMLNNYLKIAVKTIRLDNQADLTVVGIMENVPTNSHMQFDLVVRPEVFVSKERMQSWSMDCPSYILLSEGTNFEEVVNKISDSVDRYDKRGVYDCTVGLQPLDKIYLYSFRGTDPILYVQISNYHCIGSTVWTSKSKPFIEPAGTIAKVESFM